MFIDFVSKEQKHRLSFETRLSPAKIVLEHVAVQGGQVLRHDHVILQLNLNGEDSKPPVLTIKTRYLVGFHSLLEISETASLRRKSHCLH